MAHGTVNAVRSVSYYGNVEWQVAMFSYNLSVNAKRKPMLILRQSKTSFFPSKSRAFFMATSFTIIQPSPLIKRWNASCWIVWQVTRNLF